MHLAGKPDFDTAAAMWEHYWNRELLDRPLVVAQVPRPGMSRVTLGHNYAGALAGRIPEHLDLIDRWLERTEFLAEAIPFVSADFGPDQFAAFLGTDLQFSDDSPDTNWAVPVVEDWRESLPLSIDQDNRIWQRVQSYTRELADHGEGRYLVGVHDIHSNADALSALRGPQRLCTDFYDCPELVGEAMRQVRLLYRPVYERLFDAGRMGGERGSIGWTPFWCRGRFATIQCDFLALVGPDLARRTIIPALEEEASFLDHCVYHLDGPGCLPHLHDLLAIPGIDAIQWVSGAGRAPMYEWLDVLKACQKAGKGLQVYGIPDVDIVRQLSRELDPRGVVYCLEVDHRDDVLRLLDWLRRNT
jgi:hypothetical protein